MAHTLPKIREALAVYEAGHAFQRQVLLPVEDRNTFMPGAKWEDGNTYRWFRSENIICLEKVRLLRAQGRI